MKCDGTVMSDMYRTIWGRALVTNTTYIDPKSLKTLETYDKKTNTYYNCQTFSFFIYSLSKISIMIEKKNYTLFDTFVLAPSLNVLVVLVLVVFIITLFFFFHVHIYLFNPLQTFFIIT